MILYGILIAYLFIGCVYWLWMFVGTVRVVRDRAFACAVRRRLRRKPGPGSRSSFRLAMRLPRSNRPCARCWSKTTPSWKSFSSTIVPRTAPRASSTAWPRPIRGSCAIHVEQLPEGWLGKVHALALGAGKASGSWLLFTDADVHMAPGMLRRAMAYAVHHSIDHLAAVPDLWPSSLPVDAILALFGRTFSVAMRLWAVADPKSDAFIGVGAFNLVRREALDRTGGLSWLRLEVGDDAGLGMMLKESGARCCLVNAHGLLGLHWYRTLREMAHGAEKAYATAARCSLVRMLVLVVVLVAMEWAPLVALARAGQISPVRLIPGLLWSGVAMLAAAVGSSVILARWSSSRLLPALLFPLAAVVAAGIMLRSGWLGYRRGGIMWRGTLYPKDQLLAGRRLKIP